MPARTTTVERRTDSGAAVSGNGGSGGRNGGRNGSNRTLTDGSPSPERARADHRQSELRLALLARLRNLLEHLQDFRDRRDRRRDVERKVRKLESVNPDLDQVGYTRLIGYLIVGFWGVAAALLVEFFLGAPAAEFIASLAFGRGRVAEAAKIAVPLAIVILELLAASQIQLAQMDQRTDPLASPTRARLWKVFGFGLAVAMPILTLFTMKTGFDMNGGLSGFAWMLIAVWLIGLFAHMAIVFGGESAHLARAYVLYRIRHGWMERRLRRARSREQRTRNGVRDAFRLYDDTCYEYENAYGALPRAGRLTAAEQRVLMAAVEEDLPEDFDPDSGGAEEHQDVPGDAVDHDEGLETGRDDDTPTETPHPGPRNDGEGDQEPENGELAYLRSQVRQQMRDTDGVLSAESGGEDHESEESSQ